MMCAEDDLDDTVVPRLLAVNADLRLVDFINVVTEYPGGLTSTGMIRLPGDVDPCTGGRSERADGAPGGHGPGGLLLRPLALHALSNQDVRDALEPMVAIAQMYGITIVIILHLNKNESRDFAARIAESHGFQALARSVMALGPDPDDQDGATRGAEGPHDHEGQPGQAGHVHGMRCEVRSVTLSTSRRRSRRPSWCCSASARSAPTTC
jgi:hypothetical protein